MAKNLIEITTLCSHYEIDFSFVETIHHVGLIQIHVIEEVHFLDQDQIGILEKIIRLHDELKVNIEGIDVVFNLLEKAGDSLHFVNPPTSARAWSGVRTNKNARNKVIKLKRFIIILNF